MSRRLLVAIASLALAAPFAHASEAARLPLRESIARMTPELDLTRLFARLGRNAAAVETEDGVNARTIGIELVVARIGSDGKPVLACTDNPEAAQRFLQAPLERIERRKAHDQ